jgi:DNA-binding SARP family transcriptional activator/tetratricopeptide (TPR) repeat protein
MAVSDDERIQPSRRIWLLGGLRVECAGVALAVTGPKLQALLALLALNLGRPFTRDALADCLWPTAAPKRVRPALSDLLYRLRQALGTGWLSSEGDRISLRTGPDLWVDVDAFERLAARADADAAQAATELYCGELLPELFDDWLVVRRAALHERLTTCLLRVGTSAEAHGALNHALEAYRRIVQADPLHEGAVRGLMRVHGRADRRQALQVYAQLCETLAAEVGAAPQPETSALADTLRDEPPPARIPYAFVGRRHERALLLQQLERAAQGRGGVVCIEGAPGIGKTRLLESLAESARWRGLPVSWGRADEHGAQGTCAPLDQALVAAADPFLEQVCAQLSPLAVAALSGLVPGLHPAIPLQFTSPPDLAAALVSLLHALTAAAPHLIILDDVQWADPGFWELADALAALHTLPVLVVLAYRSEEARANMEVWRGLSALDRIAAPLQITLAGLPAADCAALAAEMGQSLDAATAEDLHQSTTGNPLHLVELLLAPDAADGPMLPTLLRRRLAALAPTERTALEAAAVLGGEFSHEFWQALHDEPLAAALPRLLTGRFVEQTAHGYRLQHDLIREQIYADLSPARRRELHVRALALFERHEAAGNCAWHARQAELWPQAARWYRLAGELAYASYAYAMAGQLLDQAMECADLGTISAAELLAICSMRLRVIAVTGPLPALRAAISAVEQLATELGDNRHRLQALEARVSVESLDSTPEQLQATFAAALTLAEHNTDRSAMARLQRVYGLHLLLTTATRPDQALAHLEQAVAIAEAIPDYQALVAALCTLGFGQRLLGQSTAAHASASRALAMAEVRPDLYPARADALRVLAEIALNRAEWELARATLQTTIGLLEELNDRWPLAIAYFMAASVGYAMGQHAEAQTNVANLQALARAGEVAADSHWMLYVYTCAIDAAVHAGDLTTAEQIAQAAQGLVEQPGDVQATIYLLTAFGSLRLFQNRYREACAYLERAVQLWQAAPSGMLTPMLLHATAAHLLGQRTAAEASLRLAERGLTGSDITYYNVSLYFTRFLVRGSSDDLRAAYNELQRQAARFRDESRRTAFLNEVRLHRIVARLWQIRPLAGAVRSAAGIWTQLAALYQPQAQASTIPRTLSVRLARADVPLGRVLIPTDQVLVGWTIDAGAADALVLQQHGKAALRRHRLRRLLDEAAAQGAAPTDADLAAALGVSRRTILRDMADLTKLGNAPITRRRRA